MCDLEVQHKKNILSIFLNAHILIKNNIVFMRWRMTNLEYTLLWVQLGSLGFSLLVFVVQIPFLCYRSFTKLTIQYCISFFGLNIQWCFSRFNTFKICWDTVITLHLKHNYNSTSGIISLQYIVAWCFVLYITSSIK